jgi:phage N-6-adenine-methyltransferase
LHGSANEQKGKSVITDIVTDRLLECERVIERGLNTFVEVGAALLEIRDGGLYKAGYSSFEDYCHERWGMSRPRAYQLIDAAETVGRLSTTVDILPTSERQSRPLVGLPPETQFQVWQQVVETAPEGKITGAFVQDVVDRVTRPENIHVSDDSYEWYTPIEYIEAARCVMGEIELDPASCKEANKVIGALEYFTQEDDGLSRPWFGRVWLNPPYNMPNVENFTGRAHVLYQTRKIEQAVVLVNNATDAGWFQILLNNYPACFTAGRVKFYGPNVSSGGPRQGQAIFYLGKNKQEFIREFSKFGTVVSKDDGK